MIPERKVSRLYRAANATRDINAKYVADTLQGLKRLPAKCKFNKITIMAPCHKDWNNFLWDLDKRVNLEQLDVDGHFNCKGNHDLTKAVLTENAPYINIKDTIEMLELGGGYCDCEVLFNVNDYCDGCKHQRFKCEE